VEQAELERARQLFEDAVRARLAGTAIGKVELLQYGDVPEIEPGELLGRAFLTPPEGADLADLAVRRQVLKEFRSASPGALIAAGIAGSRAEAVRWALARIRERPAYERLRARAREIGDLKSQF
jgi:hypothetical protein